MVQQPFRQVFVANTGTLLADGATVETILDGQIGVLDGKTHVSEVTPTYATQKAIKIVWGTPNLSALLRTQGIPDENEYSKLIKGKRIKSFTKIAAKNTETQEIVYIGYKESGSDTLSAQPGEIKHLFIKLTGEQITKEFSLQGVIRKFSVAVGVVGGPAIDNRDIAASLVADINADKALNKYVTASAVSAFANGSDATDGYLAGVKLVANLVHRQTDDATFQYFPAFEQEGVHIQASEFDPNYNNDVEAVVSHWVVTKTQSYSPVIGKGDRVQKLEKESLSYFLRERSSDPVVRALEKYAFKADPTAFYDEFVLEFDLDYKVGGWSERYTDAYKLHVFFPTGTGTAFQTAITGYLASSGLADVAMETI